MYSENTAMLNTDLNRYPQDMVSFSITCSNYS